MPSFDTISEWVLANLYLVGAVAGVLLLVVLLILLRAAGRRRDEGVLMEGYEVTYAGLDTFDDADIAALDMDLPTPPQVVPGGGETYDVVDDVVDDDVANEDPFAHDDVANEDPFAVVPVPAPEIAGRVHLPPAGPRGNHTRDIVQRLLSGYGDITGPELRRLELLRPEKILEVADELEAGLHGRGTESERGRLAKIRQHAHLLLPEGADLAAEQTATVGQAATPEQAAILDQDVTPDHPDPVIGDAVAIGPTLEPVYERGHEQGPVEDFAGPEKDERAGTLHSLAPAELGRLFSATDDKTMKLSIINALEDAAGPESISVLQVCLDDPDSEVQLHALEAAERLLAHQERPRADTGAEPRLRPTAPRRFRRG